MPDIDLDFQDDKRSQVMAYCAQKYGDDRVAQIITFGTLGARAAIRDVGRVMDIPLSEVDRVAKLIPNIPGKPVTLREALETISELKTLYEESGYLRELIDTASSMEGVVRNAGTHAAGVIITDKPIIEYLPLHRPTSGSEESPIKAVSQFEMSVIDVLGLLKVDFLGLATLTIMQRACDLIEKRHGVRFTLQNIPLDDPETYEFLGQGHTAGVFQLEGSGMTRYLTQMRPKNLSHIIAMVALYRPGPMSFIPSYIQRMHGLEEVTYRHPDLEDVLKETYGIPIYQEQIMFAAMRLANYTAAEADDLRKAIAKKKASEVEKHRKKFVEGAVQRGIPRQTAETIFADWEDFARYGFNKSHAADYGVIAVQTAYLKTHYTVEFMTALLSASKNDTNKVAFYVADCRSMGVDVLPPDVNNSDWDFTIEDRPDDKPAIRFGLGAIKNVGYNSVEWILKARQEGGPFQSLSDFARRVDLRQVGKRALECLIRAGALDGFGGRKALLEGLDTMMSVSASHFRAAQCGQLSIFNLSDNIEEEIVLPESGEMDRREMLEWERELIGLYVSAHPLMPYLTQLKHKVTHFSAQLGEAAHREKVVVAGMVTRFRQHQTKTGKAMGFVTLEDMQGNIELVLFPRVWEQYHHLIEPDVVLTVEGSVDAENGDVKVLVDRVIVEEVDVEVQEDMPYLAPADMERSQADEFEPVSFDDADEERQRLLEGEAPLRHQVAENPPAWTAGSDGAGMFDLEGLPPPPEVDDWHLVDEHGRRLADAAVRESQEERAATASMYEAPAVAAPVKDQPVPQPERTIKTEVPYLISPAERLLAVQQKEEQPRMLTIVLRPSGDRERDMRRLRHIHGLLVSCPGKDHFAFMLFEFGSFYLIEFPNYTTHITPELMQRLIHLVGEENIRVEPIHVH